MEVLIATLLAVGAGFVVAGITSSAYRLATDGRVRFAPRSDDPVGRAVQVALLIVSGPLVIMRNAWLGAVRGDRPFYWFALSAAIATVWSFCLGLALLNLVQAISIGG